MSLLNIDLNASSLALKQAVLPVSVGGLGTGPYLRGGGFTGSNPPPPEILEKIF
jgi:hypothetical protein